MLVPTEGPQEGYRQYIHTSKYKVINVIRMIQSSVEVQKKVGSGKRKLYKSMTFEGLPWWHSG